MNFKSLVAQLANRINQPHVIEIYMRKVFASGVEWQKKQSPWIRVEERLPDEEQRVLVGFLYYYKYDDREAESRKHIDVFTYENGIWTTDSDISYLGKSVEKDDIRLYVGCLSPLSMRYSKPTGMCWNGLNRKETEI